MTIVYTGHPIHIPDSGNYCMLANKLISKTVTCNRVRPDAFFFENALLFLSAKGLEMCYSISNHRLQLDSHGFCSIVTQPCNSTFVYHRFKN
jgi:hypothetical protein